MPPAKPNPVWSRLRELLSPRDAAALARDIAQETIATESAAKRLGAEPHYERTREMLRNPSVDSVMALSGGAKPGVFYPATTWAGRGIETAQRAGIPARKAAELLTQMSETGMYNPVTKRVAFPAGLPANEERQAAIRVAAQKYAAEKERDVEQRRRDEIGRIYEATPVARRRNNPAFTEALLVARQALKDPAEAYEQPFGVAYNFLTESARNPSVTMQDVQRLGKLSPDAPRIVREMLQDPLFAKHPLARGR